MVVSIGPGKPLTVSAPVKLFEIRPASYIPYNVMPDGTFIVNNQQESRKPGLTSLRLLLNWETMLKK